MPKSGVGIGRRRRRMLDLDLAPVGVQLLGNQHGQRGPDALAHLGMGQQHGDGVVLADPQEGVGRERARPARGSARANRLAPGTVKAITSPPVTSAPVLRNSRRVEVVGALMRKLLSSAARCTAARMRW